MKGTKIRALGLSLIILHGNTEGVYVILSKIIFYICLIQQQI